MLLLACIQAAIAGDTLRVLFIGNSYTQVQNLPDVVRRLASAGGDSLYYRSNAPGGATFQQHCGDAATLSMIGQGGWDYVVLQEQSQRPSFSDDQVAAEVYPYARKLDSLVHVYSPCAKTVFYMTWGRKNGDASNCAVWPPVCTYAGMDSLLQLRYTIMAEQNQSMICPVAKIWRRLRMTHPGLELYQSDESHPTPAGTYAAAVGFYSLFFGREPQQAGYNFILSQAEAAAVKTAAQAVVYDSLAYWQRYYPLPGIDSIAFDQAGNTYHFFGVQPRYVLGYIWDFGDGSPLSYEVSPEHTFAAAGPHHVCLTVYGACDTVTYCRLTDGTTGIAGRGSDKTPGLCPNPAKDYIDVVGMEKDCSYRIFNSMGARVREGRTEHHRIQIEGLPSGMYFIRLEHPGGQAGILRFQHY